MKRLAGAIALIVLNAHGGVVCAQDAETSDRAALIGEIVNRSMLLEDAWFRMSRSAGGGSSSIGAIGVKFRKGNNDLNYTIVDEAQFRTLMELAQAGAAAGVVVDPNETRQDTIVGADALLANDMTTYVNRSGDKGNTLDINDNPIGLSHERYVLVDNGGFLTAIRAGQMRYWSRASENIEFFKAPQEIEIPRVGKPVKLEKTLVKPSDEMVIRFDYRWRGK